MLALHTSFLTTSFVTTSLSLLKSTEKGTLSTSNLSTLLYRSDFLAKSDASTPVAFFRSAFVA